LGVVGWRHQAVSVVSFENLQGQAIQQPRLRSKVVIFYPLRGCEEWDFFGILSSAEPQPHTVDESIVEAETGDVPDSQYISTAIKVEEKFVAIPDLDALRGILFPK
jgi:chemotaxis signal transduction protein